MRAVVRNTPSLFDSPVAATVIIPDVDACDPATKRLDVVYKIFTTKIALALTGTPENRASATADPAARLAIARAPVRYQVTPVVRYNELERLVAGTRGWASLGPGRSRLEAGVEGSREVVNVDLAFTGSRESDAGLFRALEWNVGYHRRDRPTERNTLHEQRVVGQATGVTRPISAAGAVFRFASSLQGRSDEADVPRAIALPIGTLADAKSGVWRGAAGISLQSRHHAFAGSYGLQLGLTRGDAAVDYAKSIAEASYDGRLILGAAMRHHPLDIAVRSGAGRLSGDESVPLGERFFGGNTPVQFLEGQGWDFRNGPVLRSFPAFGFDRADRDDIGGDAFFSLNVTVAVPIWVRPLVPREVSSDATLRQALGAQLDSAEQILQTTHKMTDPAHARARETARTLEPQVKALEARLSSITGAIPASLKARATACDAQVAEFIPIAESVSNNTFVGSLLNSSVDEDEVTLSSMMRVCLDELNAELRDPDLGRIGAQLTASRQAIAEHISQIDGVRAQRLAARDMTFARGAVTTLLDEMNVISLAPTLTIDAARLSQRAPQPSDLTRYAVGTGLRLSVASAFHVTAGYAWNINRSSPERRGAAFVTVEVASPFGR